MQIYQFKVKYGIEDENYGNYNYETADNMLVEMRKASKEHVAIEYSLQIIDEVDEKSEVDNYHNKYKRNRCT